MNFWFLLLSLSLSLISCRSSAQSIIVPVPTHQSISAHIIKGTISYLENINTPTPFWAEVELCELKDDGSAGTIIAKMMVESPRQMPVGYRLIIDPNKISKNKKYGLIARVFVDFDNLMWENKIPKEALTHQVGNHIDIIVDRTISKNKR